MCRTPKRPDGRVIATKDNGRKPITLLHLIPPAAHLHKLVDGAARECTSEVESDSLIKVDGIANRWGCQAKRLPGNHSTVAFGFLRVNFLIG